MIADFNEASSPHTFSTDICIIGSGAAALVMLSRLYTAGRQVLVLEAGGEQITHENQQLYDVITPQHPLDGARNGRFRVFGGSTTRWGGQALPLDPLDFKQRDWIPHSGWPISYDTVAAYYPEVDRFLNVDPLGYDTDIYSLSGQPPLALDKDIQLRFSKWSPSPNLRNQYRDRINKSATIQLVKNANVMALNLTPDGSSIQSLTIKNQVGRVGEVRAKQVVLACGGIENARLLLVSNQQQRCGVGNTRDIVGRFLQDHPNAEIGTLPTGARSQQPYLNYFYVKQTRLLPRLFVAEDFLAQKQLLNTNIYIQYQAGEHNAFDIAKTIYRRQLQGNLSLQDVKLGLRLIRKLPQLVSTAKQYYLHRRVYIPQAVARVDMIMETLPSPANRIELSNDLDRLGMPKVVIKWQIDPLVQRTMLECTSLVKTHLERVGLGVLQENTWLSQGNWTEHIKDAKHHIGTTRMASSPREGVVNEDCRVHGIANLYVAGSSVFPTSGHSNPTATLLALALRLTDHLLALPK